MLGPGTLYLHRLALWSFASQTCISIQHLSLTCNLILHDHSTCPSPVTSYCTRIMVVSQTGSTYAQYVMLMLDGRQGGLVVPKTPTRRLLAAPQRTAGAQSQARDRQTSQLASNRLLVVCSSVHICWHPVYTCAREGGGMTRPLYCLQFEAFLWTPSVSDPLNWAMRSLRHLARRHPPHWSCHGRQASAGAWRVPHEPYGAAGLGRSSTSWPRAEPSHGWHPAW